MHQQRDMPELVKEEEMAAYNEALTLDEFIMFGCECHTVSGVMQCSYITDESVFLGPVTFITH